MFDKTLLRNEEWQVTIGMLGFGEIRIKSADGCSETASAAERGHVLDTLIALGKKALPFDEFMAVRELILRKFADAVHGQRTGEPLALPYDAFFGIEPETMVDIYLRIVRRR